MSTVSPIIYLDVGWWCGITWASPSPNSKDSVIQLRKASKHFLQLRKCWESYQTVSGMCKRRAKDKQQYICGTTSYIVVLLAWQPEWSGSSLLYRDEEMPGISLLFRVVEVIFNPGKVGTQIELGVLASVLMFSPPLPGAFLQVVFRTFPATTLSGLGHGIFLTCRRLKIW